MKLDENERKKKERGVGNNTAYKLLLRTRMNVKINNRKS